MTDEPKKLRSDEIGTAVFRHFVVRILLLLATGLWLLINKEAGSRTVSREDAEGYQKDLFDLTEAMKQYLTD